MNNLYIVWRDYQRRAEVVAPLLDADAVFLPHRFRSMWARPLDYLDKFVRTAVLLARRRPGFVVFQAPPPFAALPALLMGIPYVVDAHNRSFQSRWARVPGTATLLKRARVVIAHNDEIAALARSVFPEARVLAALDPVPELPGAGAPDARDPSQVLLICSFGRDEPVAVILDVIAGAPELSFVLTADPGKLTEAQRARLTALPNVRLTGFLSTPDYQRVLARSAAAVVLSTRPATQPSGACEALSSDTPLVVSRSTLTSRLFGSWAHVVDTTAAAVLAALRDPGLRPRDLSEERRRWNAEVEASLAEVKRLASTLGGTRGAGERA